MFDGLTVFQYSKPVELIKTLLKFVRNKNLLVLDFFAGSGTTGQAVMESNKEDLCDRSFILCTNNENNICEEITYKRLFKTIMGYQDINKNIIGSMHSNLKYYKTLFISKDNENEEVNERLLAYINEMIQLEYGIRIDDKKYVVILDDDEMDKFEEGFLNYPDFKAVFLNQEVLLSTAQEKLLENVNTYIIPDYYFGEELREAGELW